MKKLMVLLTVVASSLLSFLRLAAQAPTITTFTPSSGAVGTLVTITGTNLTSPTAFTIGGVAAIRISGTSTRVVGMVMPGATSGAIVVTTGAGSATAAGSFTVTATAYPRVQQGSKFVGAGNVGVANQGCAVAVSADGNTAVVGGYTDNSSIGATWIFTRFGSVWSQQGGKLVGTGSLGAAEQGYSVAISADGNTVITGADNDNSGQGAVWVFRRSGVTWTQEGTKLVGTGNIGAARQGSYVSLSADGNTAISGGIGDNSNQGAAWVFTRTGTTWTQQGNKLVGAGSIGAARQGFSVALSADGNTALVGGDRDNSSIGAAWVFSRNGNSWTQQGKLIGAGYTISPGQGFGVALSADGNTAVVGGPTDNTNRGAVWVFTRSSNVWSQQGNKLVGTGFMGPGQQGFAVSVSADGNTIISGAPHDNGDLGASWIFTRSAGTWSQRGSKLVGTGNTGIAAQGYYVAISPDGNIGLVGGPFNASFAGGVWAFGQLPSISGAQTMLPFTTTYGTASAGRIIAISGANLTANLVATAPAGFEVSSNGTNYGSTATFTQAAGIANGSLSIRLAATAPVIDAYNSQSIVLSSAGATNVNITTAAFGNSVTAAVLTITGISAVNKVYDGLTTATLSGSPAYAGLKNNESFSVSGTPVATFGNAAVGTGKMVSVTGYNAPSINYTVSQPSSLTANITAAGLTITGVSANNKFYDGLTTATLSGMPSYIGLKNGETFSVSGTPAATFNAASAGNTIPVTVAGYTAPNANYTVDQPAGLKADIIPAGLTITGISANDKPYDGNTTATLAGSPAYEGLKNNESFAVTGTPVAAFATASVGNNKPVTITGYTAPNANYSITQPTGITANILGVAPAIADYRSKADGNFSSFGPSGVWEINQGDGSWIDAPQAPGSNNNVQVTHRIVLDQNYTVGASKNFNLAAGATFILNPLNTFTVAGSADFEGQPVTFKSDATGTASLGQVTGSITGATNVTVERYIPNNGFRSWRLLSVPTFGSQTIKQSWQEGNAALQNNTPGYGTQIAAAGNVPSVQAAGFDNASAASSLQRYNGTAWVNMTSTLNPISNEKAYFLFVRGDRSQGVIGATNQTTATTLRTRGSIYTGNQTSATLPANSFSVLGNPYVSAIDFTGLTRNGGVNNTFYIWDSKKMSGTSLGAYQTFSAINNFNCLLPGGSFVEGEPNTAIQSGQAFFVQTGGTSGTVTFTENSKISRAGNLGFRPTPPAERVKIATRLYSANNLADANLVVFDAAYANEVDGDDALKLANPGENMAIKRNNQSLAIEGRPTIDLSDTVQFNTWNLQQQVYRLKFEASNMIGLTATLQDKFLNSSTRIDLSATSSVNFTVTADTASRAADRFRLVFTQAAPLPVSFLSVSANRTAAGVQAKWSVAAERNISKYEVERSTNGRNFAQAGTVTATGNNNDQTYVYNDATAPAGTLFYRVKSIGIAGEVKYSSIVKVAAGAVKASYSIAPNPVEGGVVNLQFTNQPAGLYHVRLLNGVGQSLMTQKALHAGGSTTQLLILPAHIASGIYQVEIVAPDKTHTRNPLLVNAQ